MRKLRSNFIGVAFIVIASMATSAYCDVMIKQVIQNDEYNMMGQTIPEIVDTSITWLGDGMARVDQSDTASWIYLAEESTIYMLNHKEKTFTRISFGDLGKDEGEDDTDNMKGMMEAMGSMMKLDITVTPTDETKKINEWNCKKYLVESKMAMMTSNSITWATEDIEMDYDLLTTISNSFLSILPDFEDAIEEMKKVKGITIYNEVTTSMMGAKFKSTTEVLEYKETDAPTGTYKIPTEYKKTDLFRY